MKIARIFLDVDMRTQFQGLRSFLRKNGHEPKVWGKGDLVVFVNRAGTAFKVLAGNDYLVYYNHKSRVPLEAIQYLPQFFGGTEFEFSKAIEKSLRTKLRWLNEVTPD